MDVSKLYERAEDAVKRKNYDYAIEVLKNQILSIYPDDVKARKLLRGCENRKFNEDGYPSASQAQLAGLMPMIKITLFKLMKKWEKVMEECENYLLKDPRNKRVLGTLGSAAANAGYMDTAISQYEACLEVDPQHVPSLRALGYLYEATEDLAKAIDFFKLATKLDQTDGESKRKLKNISAMISQRDFAGKSSRDSIKDKGEAERLEHEDRVLRTKEDYADAIDRTKKELEANPDDPYRHLRRLGELYQQLGEPKPAVEYYEKALEHNPTSFDITVRIGDVKIDTLERRVKKYRKAAKNGDGDAKKKLAGATGKLRDYQVEEYTRRVTEHPTDLDLRFQLGRVSFLQGSYNDAISHLQKSTKHPKRRQDSYNFLGQAFMKQDEFDLAIKQFSKALEDMNRDDDRAKVLRYNLAQAYEAIGDTDAALTEYQDIMEVDINYKDVKARVKKMRG